MDRKLDELLFALMQNMTIAVSGEKLARDLDVSHSTLVRWVEKLRAARVEIRGELFTGYRLTRLPDVMLPQLIRPRLRTQTLGKNIFHFFSIDSTNAFATRLLNHGRKVIDGTVIISESQTAGKGGAEGRGIPSRRTGFTFLWCFVRRYLRDLRHCSRWGRRLLFIMRSSATRECNATLSGQTTC